jgi:hypothetical protein
MKTFPACFVCFVSSWFYFSGRLYSFQEKDFHHEDHEGHEGGKNSPIPVGFFSLYCASCSSFLRGFIFLRAIAVRLPELLPFISRRKMAGESAVSSAFDLQISDPASLLNEVAPRYSSYRGWRMRAPQARPIHRSGGAETP